jgi:hypothetical protein
MRNKMHQVKNNSLCDKRLANDDNQSYWEHGQRVLPICTDHERKSVAKDKEWHELSNDESWSEMR